MGFIKNALVGIALYEVVKYLLNKEDIGSVYDVRRTQVGSAGPYSVSGVNTVRNVSNPGLDSQESGVNLDVGTNPNTPLTGKDKSVEDLNNPWKNSLANDELRAPDS